MKRFWIVWALFWVVPTHILGCGISLHMWIAKQAITQTKGQLRQFLECHRDYVYYGAVFPDSGYKSGYGEEAHWASFWNAYIDYIKATCRQENTEMSLRGECGNLTAFFFGSMAHSLGDTCFDSKFLAELVAKGICKNLQCQHDYDPGLDALMISTPSNDIFFDIMRSDAKPATHHLTNILNNAGILINGNAVKNSDVDCGLNMIWWAQTLQRVWAYALRSTYLPKIHQWAVDNVMDAPGGIKDSGQYVAGFWEEMWLQITEVPRDRYYPKRVINEGRWPNKFFLWQNVTQTP
jgi:hypothetical protein